MRSMARSDWSRTKRSERKVGAKDRDIGRVKDGDKMVGDLGPNAGLRAETVTAVEGRDKDRAGQGVRVGSNPVRNVPE